MNNLKHYRNTVGAKQKDIGDIVGVEQSTIDRYESGARGVNVQMAWNLVRALNSLGAKCTLEQVFPHSEESQPQS